MSTETESSQDAEYCTQLIKDNMAYEYCKECNACNIKREEIGASFITCDHPAPDVTNCRLLKTLLYKS